MPTRELLAQLARDYPNGVSFEPMALRLLRKKATVTDLQIEKLKAEMFQLENGLWVSPEMILDNVPRLALVVKAKEWLKQFGLFSVEKLYDEFPGVFRIITTIEDRANFLRHLGFTVSAWKEGSNFCFIPATSLTERLEQVSEKILGWLDEADGSLTFHKIEQMIPQLSAEAIETIRMHFIPEVHKTMVAGVTCWQSIGALFLPEDFSEKLTFIVDKLLALGEKVSAANLQLALSMQYNVRFREEYPLQENATFMRVCKNNYQGCNNAFPNSRKSGVKANQLPVIGKRVRSPNSLFRNIGVPVGAKLVFTKNSEICCVVVDDTNQVEYAGKAWAISALAMHLLRGKVTNGFSHFIYEGETLWDRRLRLEREGKHIDCNPKPKSKPMGARGREDVIIGLEGRELSPATWRIFKCAYKDPRVAEWAQRIDNGGNVEEIAQKAGIKIETVKKYLDNRRLYLLVCDKNGIEPEGDVNV